MAFTWYTNGQDNIKIYQENDIPEGYQKGFTLKENTLARKAREKKNKEINKNYIKTLPLKDRKQVYKQNKFDKLSQKEIRHFLNEVHIPLLAMRIREDLHRGLDYNQIFENRMLKDHKYSNDFNKLLQDYILEQALIYQLSTMPMYLNTIVDSLKELYSKNKALRHRKDLISYFTSIFE